MNRHYKCKLGLQQTHERKELANTATYKTHWGITIAATNLFSLRFISKGVICVWSWRLRSPFCWLSPAVSFSSFNSSTAKTYMHRINPSTDPWPNGMSHCSMTAIIKQVSPQLTLIHPLFSHYLNMTSTVTAENGIGSNCGCSMSDWSH